MESYIDGSPIASNQPFTSSAPHDLNLSPSLSGKLSCLTQKQLTDVILESLALLQPSVNLAQLLVKFFNEEQEINALGIIEKLYSWLATKNENFSPFAWLCSPFIRSYEKAGSA